MIPDDFLSDVIQHIGKFKSIFIQNVLMQAKDFLKQKKKLLLTYFSHLILLRATYFI
jgi:hypothetical protein